MIVPFADDVAPVPQQTEEKRFTFCCGLHPTTGDSIYIGLNVTRTDKSAISIDIKQLMVENMNNGFRLNRWAPRHFDEWKSATSLYQADNRFGPDDVLPSFVATDAKYNVSTRAFLLICLQQSSIPQGSVPYISWPVLLAGYVKKVAKVDEQPFYDHLGRVVHSFALACNVGKQLQCNPCSHGVEVLELCRSNKEPITILISLYQHRTLCVSCIYVMRHMLDMIENHVAMHARTEFDDLPAWS